MSAVAPALLVPASIVVVGVYVFLLWRSRDEPSVLMWALLVGLVAVPYVATYSVVPVLASIPLFALAARQRAAHTAPPSVAPLKVVPLTLETDLPKLGSEVPLPEPELGRRSG